MNKYNLSPLFDNVQQEISSGKYKQALTKLKLLETQALPEAKLLASECHSQLGEFEIALAIQNELLKYPHPQNNPVFNANLFLSKGYTLGYVGDMSGATQCFQYARELFLALKNPEDTYRGLQAMIGEYDIHFYHQNWSGDNTLSGKKFLEWADHIFNETLSHTELSEENRNVLESQCYFRKALVYWLTGDYHQAKPCFEKTFNLSQGYPSGVWALFGLLYCAAKTGDIQGKKRWEKRLRDATNNTNSAWKKAGLKFWTIALLAGRTYQEIHGNEQRAQKLYYDVLLNVRKGYTDQNINNKGFAEHITAYFFPVCREAVINFLFSEQNFHRAVVRAERFRSCLLSKAYRKYHPVLKEEALYYDSVKAEDVARELQERNNGDLSFLYGFDFKDRQEAVLLFSKDLKTYEPFFFRGNAYREMADIARSPKELTCSDLNQVSRNLQDVLAQVSTGRLLIIPHGLFNHIPFQSLLKNGDPLIKTTVVSYWPSLQMAVVGERDISVDLTNGVTMLYTSTDKDCEAECFSIRGIFKQKGVQQMECLRDPSGSEVADTLSRQKAAAHLVVHGEYDPDLSTTVLRFKDTCDLSALSSQMKSSPKLVMLNVCHGGYVEHDSIDSLKGMPVTFFQKGAEAAIMTGRAYFKDFATQFAGEFYEQFLAGIPLGEAYQKAACRLIKSNEKHLRRIPYILGNSRIVAKIVNPGN